MIPKMVKVHMTFNDYKRIISFRKGGKVKELRYRFLRDFSFVFHDKVAPADVKFQRYDRSLKMYLDTNDDDKLESDTKMLATVRMNIYLLSPLRLPLPSK